MSGSGEVDPPRRQEIKY